MFPMTKLLKPECQATLSIALVAIVQLQKPRKKHGKSQPFKPYLKALKTGMFAFMMQQIQMGRARYLIHQARLFKQLLGANQAHTSNN